MQLCITVAGPHEAARVRRGTGLLPAVTDVSAACFLFPPALHTQRFRGLVLPSSRRAGAVAHPCECRLRQEKGAWPGQRNEFEASPGYIAGPRPRSRKQTADVREPRG